MAEMLWPALLGLVKEYGIKEVCLQKGFRRGRKKETVIKGEIKIQVTL